MVVKYAVGKKAFGFCDICGQRYKLADLRPLTVKTKLTNIKACTECWSPDHPQLQLGMYPVQDFWALRNPRPDTSYYQSGLNGLQLDNGSGMDPDQTGTPDGGSRMYQWGFNPVGGARFNDVGLTPNYLVATTAVGSVTVSVN